ncbi:hypothetical protein [Sporisorium scitamineum]|uniref:Uncharacterized protein n=1 Tax=Sporisorium scitamineum TaxID=49012 RepID=A0A0F7RVV4_9BASI|nr:hypothetical protein [Sporisorium scitamineum]
MTLSRASFQAFLFFLIAAALYGRRAAATRDNERPLDYHYQAEINHPSTSFSFPTFAEPSQYEHVMHTGTMQPTTGGSPDMFHFGASPPFLAPVYGSAAGAVES